MIPIFYDVSAAARAHGLKKSVQMTRDARKLLTETFPRYTKQARLRILLGALAHKLRQNGRGQATTFSPFPSVGNCSSGAVFIAVLCAGSEGGFILIGASEETEKVAEYKRTGRFTGTKSLNGGK